MCISVGTDYFVQSLACVGLSIIFRVENIKIKFEFSKVYTNVLIML
jgi:hypothetical protein